MANQPEAELQIATLQEYVDSLLSQPARSNSDKKEILALLTEVRGQLTNQPISLELAQLRRQLAHEMELLSNAVENPPLPDQNLAPAIVAPEQMSDECEVPPPYEPDAALRVELRKRTTAWMAFTSLNDEMRQLLQFEEVTKQTLETWQSRIQGLAQSIESLRAEAVKEAFFEWMMNLHQCVRAIRLRFLHSEASRRGSGSSGSSASSMVGNQPNQNYPAVLLSTEGEGQTLNLPKRNVRPFSGERWKWPAFKTELKLLLSDRKYARSVKFEELANAVSHCPRAAGVISKFHAGQKLEEAIQALIDYYEDPALIEDDIENIILHVKELPRRPSAEQWEGFYLEVQKIVQLLGYCDLGRTMERRFVRLLRPKLPETFDGVIREEHGEIDKFMELVEQCWRSATRLKAETNCRTVSQKARKPEPRRNNQGQVAAMSSQSQPLGRDYTRVCLLCDSEAHPTQQCSVVTGLQNRYDKFKQKEICFRCLRNKHPCNCGQKCPRCRRKHHVILCRATNQASRNNAAPAIAPANPAPDANAQEPTRESQFAGYQTVTEGELIELRGVPVRQVVWCHMQAKNQNLLVRVFLDPGSEVTLVSPRVVQMLDLHKHNVRAMYIRGPGSEPIRCDHKVCFNLAATDGSMSTQVQAWVYDQLSTIVVPPPPQELLDRLTEMNVPTGEQLSTRAIPDLVIGVEYLERQAFSPIEARRVTHSVVAYRLPLGWSLRGYYEGETSRVRNFRSYVAAISATPAEPCVCPCGSLRSVFGIQDDDEQEPTAPLQIRYSEDDRRYFIRLPWTGKQRPRHNYLNAKHQVIALRKRLAEKGVIQAYHAAIRELLSAGYAERVAQRYCEQGYYLPHHPVIREDATKTKIRPVFNASSASRDAWSLNDCLARGEPLNCNLLKSLINFRTTPVPLVSDVVKAFLQIRVEQEDRDYLRFLWFDDLGDSEPTVYRMTSVLFGATSSPHILGAVLQKLFAEHRDKFPALQVDREIVYMDDLFMDADSPNQVAEIMEQTKQLLSIGSFNLHGWTTTEEVRTQNPELEFNQPDPNKVCKCLGVRWDPEEDQIIIEADVEIPSNLTRREAASFLAKLYDPLDLALPFKVQVREFARKLSLEKIGWDELLSSKLEVEFKKLAQQYRELSIKVPRGSKKPTKELVIFTDASPQAFGAVAYLMDEDSQLSLLCAKGRLAPVKPSTVPKLELCAALMGAEMAAKLSTSPRLQVPCRIYCDSKITLCRIANTKQKFDTFVQNRVDKIRALQNDQVSWHYVSTSNNPADLLTHGMEWKKLKNALVARTRLVDN